MARGKKYQHRGPHHSSKGGRRSNAYKSGKGRKRDTGKRVTGIVQKTRRGFGFLLQEEEEDIFLSPRNLGGAMSGDRVQVELLAPRERRPSHGKSAGALPSIHRGEESGQTRIEGRVVRVIERAYQEITGRFEDEGDYGFVVPADPALQEDVFIGRAAKGEAREGDTVVAALLRYPGPDAPPEGRIVEILAKQGEAGGDILAVLRQKGISLHFPEEVEAEVAAIVAEAIGEMPTADRAKETPTADIGKEKPDLSKWSVPEEEQKGRVDLRKETIVTIDGAHSKDFDDAVSCRRLAGGAYELGVHIADVAHYVREDSPLDKEALRRGNSLYPLDRVVPMLPEELSNGLCSLNPGVDRLTLSCVMTINQKGECIEGKVFESVICSKGRLVYDQVSDYLESEKPKDRTLCLKMPQKEGGERDDSSTVEPENREEVFRALDDMKELALLLEKAAKERGYLDFDIPDSQIEMDRQGRPLSIGAADRRSANRLIELFMVKANEAVAEMFYKKKVPFVYRVHGLPEEDKLETLGAFISRFGLDIKSDRGKISPKELSRILERTKGESYAGVVHAVMLRAMQKACYACTCDGHFGLALTFYCHFTSPIRRYADLFIHRVIKATLIDEKKGVRASLKAAAPVAAKRATEGEVVAQEIERDLVKMKMCEYMLGHIGEVYEGIISGVSRTGFYVELPSTVEGMVRVDTMVDDYYLYEPALYRLVGDETKRTFTLGDKVRIRVTGASIRDREIDFILEESTSRPDPNSRRKGKRA